MKEIRSKTASISTLSRRVPTYVASVLLLLFMSLPQVQAHGGDDGDEPVVDQSKTSQALKSLPSKPIADRTAVTIYEFRSSSYQVTALAATDMFTTALIDSGQFRVVERAQIQQNVIREKQLNAGGQTSGTTAQKQLRGAQYIFEGTISENNANEAQKQGGVNVGGLSLGGSNSKDTIAVDVRILDADTGDVLDSIAVRKDIATTGVNVGGTAAFANSVASMFHKPTSPVVPDVTYQTAHQQGVDKALRACIDAAVLQLIRRLPAATAEKASE